MRIGRVGARERARQKIGKLRQLGTDRSAAAAVEFALTGTIFLGLVLFLVALGFRLYVVVALDHASARAARLLAVDSTQSRSGNVSAFQSVTFCPLLSPFLACNGVTISLRAVTDYSAGSIAGQPGPPSFDPGQGGSLMLLQVTYALPALGWPSPDGSGAGAFPGSSVTVYYPYQNEY